MKENKMKLYVMENPTENSPKLTKKLTSER